MKLIALCAAALLVTGIVVAPAVEYVFPTDAAIIDVKRDFGAKGATTPSSAWSC
ncbi:MAG: hypothetical protein H0W78_12405 [Planctomycetes bacterium]|nr:hypothetical protein [Planctomycetota bacterium]